MSAREKALNENPPAEKAVANLYGLPVSLTGLTNGRTPNSS